MKVTFTYKTVALGRALKCLLSSQLIIIQDFGGRTLVGQGERKLNCKGFFLREGGRSYSMNSRF